MPNCLRRGLRASIACAVAACGFASLAADGEAGEREASAAASPGVEVSVESYIGVDSRYVTYGLTSGKDPIARMNGYATFFDWWYIGGEMLFDVTKGNGKRSTAGHCNRAGKLNTFDVQTGLAHEFNLGETLGTLGVDLYFTYEWIPRHHGSMYDTDYLDVEFKLKDLWLEPRLWIERDLMLDDGLYANLEIGHTIALVGEGKKAVLTFKPSLAQGVGNTLRTRGYDLADDHGGLMDTTARCELSWAVCEHVKIKAYVAYSDYLFDRKLRHGARAHNGAWGHGDKYANSWNLYGGVGVAMSF